jgi:hypothetical protein
MATADSSRSDVNRLPALLGVAAALGLWMGGEALQEQVQRQQQRLEAASRTVLPRTAQSLPEAELGAAQIRERRVDVEQRLQTTEPLSFVQARVIHELRQLCSAEGIQGCSVKYFDEAARTDLRPAAARPAADKASAPGSLAELGLGRARAIVSGTFQDQEFRRLLDKLSRRTDPGLWRVNGLVVRNNTFEIDAELILRPAAAKSP